MSKPLNPSVLLVALFLDAVKVKRSKAFRYNAYAKWNGSRTYTRNNLRQLAIFLITALQDTWPDMLVLTREVTDRERTRIIAKWLPTPSGQPINSSHHP